MANDDNRDSGQGAPGFGESGYSILLERDKVLKFMEDGDYSSSQSLGLFEKIGSELDERVKKLKGASFFAFSMSNERLSRDFTVIQIAHFLSKRGKKVLIVDCDFLSPGLSGLVENVEELGFLDLLLYGSSLKTVARPSGIDGVSVIGSGSFPVSKTVPFAKKEFKRINDFLRERSDVVIYCSTLYTEEGSINPLAGFVDGVILAFRIEDTEEGQLQKSHSELEELGISAVETICLCSGRETGEGAPSYETGEGTKPGESGGEGELPGEKEALEVSRGTEEEGEEPEEDLEPGFIEKTVDIESEEEASKKGLSVLRIATIVAGVLVVAFISWWVLFHRSMEERDRSERIDQVVQQVKEAGKEVSTEKDTAGEEKDAGRPESGVGEAKSEGMEEQRGMEQPPADSAETAASTGGPEVKEAEAGETGESPEAEGESESPAKELYSVHVASFKDITRAGREAEFFESEGYRAKVIEVEVKGEKWFRVLVGGYSSREEAGKARVELLSYSRIGYARVVSTGGAQ